MINTPRFHRLAAATLLAATMGCHSPATVTAQEQSEVRIPSAGANEMASFVNGNIDFAFNVYKQFKNSQANIFFAPHSLSTCLAMTYAGARGETEKEMAQALGYGTNAAHVHELFARLQPQLNDVGAQKGIELRSANSVWAQAGGNFLPEFEAIIQKDYGTAIQRADFSTGGEKLRTEINEWVERNTDGKIKDLMPSGMPDAASRLLLVNAAYFKARWAHQFAASNTIEAPFTNLAETTVPAHLMHMTGNFKYGEVLSLQMLELPYAGNDLSMLVLLPTNNMALSVMEKWLSAGSLNLWLSFLHEQKTEVYLPKFKLTETYDMKTALEKSTLTEAMTDKADFSGMDGRRDLFLSTVIQKAFVEVNEEGTEAAAATGAVMSMKAVKPAVVPVFRADHGFIFVIRDNRTGTVLFLGRLADPTK